MLNAQEYLAKFDSPNLANATNKNDIWFTDLRQKLMTVYVILPGNTQTYGTIAAIFFEQLLQICAQKEPSSDEKSINLIIDEFANLPKMPSLLKGITYLRSYRIRVCAMVQQISQLKAVYGEEGKNGFLASPVKMAFNITSLDDAKYFSLLTGKKTSRVKSISIGQKGGYTTSVHKKTSELYSIDNVFGLRKSRLVIILHSNIVLLSGKIY